MSHGVTYPYRSDIDGLRAVAVLAVVLYHFGIGGISGGFVGVDVFYVISGFLITGIIQKEIEQGRFTFRGFYERLGLPALFVVLAAILIASYFVFLPSDLVLLGKSTLATLAFGSNIFFWRTSGYFDTTSELNPLLHTWSLAVEEQFYIGLPILLILVYRYARKWLKPILILCALLSFLACIWVQQLRPEAAFYLSPFRAWELLIGSLLAVGQFPKIKQPGLREVIAGVGFMLLSASIYSISEGNDFPGWLALGPVLGTAFVIYAGSSGPTMIGKVLSWRPVVYIGLISYSLYLWHWPVLVFTKYLNFMEPIGLWSYGSFCISLILAAASYQLIETPFRVKKTLFSRKILFIFALTSTLILLVMSAIYIVRKGYPSRFPSEIVALDSERSPFIPFIDCHGKAFQANLPNAECIMGLPNFEPEILVWGDSHALSWAPALNAIFLRNSKSALLAYHSACPPLLGINNPISKNCFGNNESIFRSLSESEKIKVVILVASWRSYDHDPAQYRLVSTNGLSGNNNVFPNSFISTINELLKARKKVIIIGPTPGAPSDVPLKMALSMIAIQKGRMYEIPPEKSLNQHYQDSKVFFKLTSAMPYVKLINPAPWYCSQTSCRYQIDGKPLYRDGGHLSIAGALYSESKLEANLEEIGK